MFESFTAVAPIGDDTVGRYAAEAPPGLPDVWRRYGAGWIGDGYFRLADPSHADTVGRAGVPGGSLVVFTTALADLVVWAKGLWLVVKPRLGTVQFADLSLTELVDLLPDARGDRDAVWQWQPYPAAAARLGVPGVDECLMHVPLLALGGRGDPATMARGNLWVHLALLSQTGSWPVTGGLPLPDTA
jgi:hypothetical protein